MILTCVAQVAMVRAQVCIVSDTSSGVKHLKLIKVSISKLTEIDDQEAAYLDVKGITVTHTFCRTFPVYMSVLFM